MLFLFPKKTVDIIAFLPDFLASVKERAPMLPIDSNNLNKGLMQPIWCDFKLKVTTDGFQYIQSIKKPIPDTFPLANHIHEETGHLYLTDYIHIKINTPWLLKTNIPMFYQPMLSIPNTVHGEYFTAPGVIQSKLNIGISGSNAFCFIKTPHPGEEPKVYSFVHNTPLYNIIPITDKKIRFKTEVVSKDDYYKIACNLVSNITFTSGRLRYDFLSNKLKGKISG
jgi:hypothetical protein